MAITRKFLDWSEPALPAVADYLIETHRRDDRLNLEDVVLVLPGGRAGRRLMEILVGRAQDAALIFFPPQIRTAGTVPELLYESKHPFASDLVQQLAWVQALKQMDHNLSGQLAAEMPADADFANWMDLAQLILRQHRELAADGLDFDDVVRQGPLARGFREADRWRFLSSAQQHYLRVLDELGLWDLQTARLFAIEHRQCRSENEIILVAMADMNRVLRLMFDQIADRVTALVHAPESWSDRFDQYGCLVPASWQDVPVPIKTEQILVRQSPVDQADAATEQIAAFDGRYRADQIVIGVLDEQLVPQIQRSLLQANVPSRWVVGATLTETAPCRLLAAISQFAEQQRFTPFASLVRHPDVESWLESQGIAGDYLAELDDYCNRHLQPSLGKWLGAADKYESLKKAVVAVNGIVQPLNETAAEDLRTLADWGAEIARLLCTIYAGRDFDRDDASEAQALEALSCIRNVLAEHQQVPASIQPKLTAWQAIGQVLDQLSGVEIPSLPDEQAVELLGWLELPLDTAPALIVTSFNESFVPKSVNSDLFLPNTLRQQLGLVDNTRRYARDGYALNVLVASRQELQLIVGRRTADGDPLIPSRLAFATDAETMARRVLLFFHPDESTLVGREMGSPVEANSDRAHSDSSLLIVRRPPRLSKPVESLRVTAFRDYLACPYRFYLRHVLGLELLDDDIQELSARHFGTTAHEVLSRFGQDAVAESTDPKEIRHFLNDALNRHVTEAFGNDRYPAVEVQITQLRSRLDHFAQWQADWAGQGWRIMYTETAGGESPATLPIGEGQSMKLSGRIDRIDRHEQTGEWAIFDYKTSDTPKKPESVHQVGGRWVDLQLPLYRHLARSLGIDESAGFRLGYIVLPKDITKVGALFASWDERALASADAESVRVAAAIRNEVFWPPAIPPPRTLTDYATICQDHSFRPNFEQVVTEGTR